MVSAGSKHCLTRPLKRCCLESSRLLLKPWTFHAAPWLGALLGFQTLRPAPGHLTGLVPPEAERALLVAFNALVLVFAARKYTQAVKDDIGDKSVFQCARAPRLHAVVRAAIRAWRPGGVLEGDVVVCCGVGL